MLRDGTILIYDNNTGRGFSMSRIGLYGFPWSTAPSQWQCMMTLLLFVWDMVDFYGSSSTLTRWTRSWQGMLSPWQDGYRGLQAMCNRWKSHEDKKKKRMKRENILQSVLIFLFLYLLRLWLPVDDLPEPSVPDLFRDRDSGPTRSRHRELRRSDLH